MAIPQFPIEPDSVTVLRSFHHLIASDLASAEAVEDLVLAMFENPDVDFYYLVAKNSEPNPFIREAEAREDLRLVAFEKFYYRTPLSDRDFRHIPAARDGDFAFPWQREIVEKGPEYSRIQLKVSDRKRLELEILRRIELEHSLREQVRLESNRVDVFLSFAVSEQAEADKIYTDILAAGGRAFLSKKSLTPGDDFADAIREAILATTEVWLLLSPASLKSEWVLTEWGAAWGLRKPIVPILYRCSPQDVPGRLARLQCIDLHRYPELIRSRFEKKTSRADPQGK